PKQRKGAGPPLPRARRPWRGASRSGLAHPGGRLASFGPPARREHRHAGAPGRSPPRARRPFIGLPFSRARQPVGTGGLLFGGHAGGCPCFRYAHCAAAFLWCVAWSLWPPLVFTPQGSAQAKLGALTRVRLSVGAPSLCHSPARRVDLFANF
ncbi:unnamed protein product, partial [Amoebophrya sp. A120]